MCSIEEGIDDEIELIPEEIYQHLKDALCQKCNSEKAVLQLRGKDVYCDSCFLISATHKFRATLGKSKIVRPSDKVLVAYTGDASSTALLHLIRAGMHESVHKRLVFETKVVFIDDGAVKGHSLEDRKKRVNEIGRQIDCLGFESYAVSLDEILKTPNEDIEKLEKFLDSLSESSTDDERLKNIFDKLLDHTSKIELLRRLRQKLILLTARKLKCTKVFVSDDSTSLAIDILSNVALGRGAQLSFDVGFLDTRYQDTIVLRPMRDFTRHELNCYLNIHKLEIVQTNELESFAGPSSPQSIQSLTEKFVTGLDSKFHGTVSTVFRTGEKVSATSPDSDKKSDETCVLCAGILDTAASDTIISVIQATAFSRFVSSQGPNAGNIDLEQVKEVANSSIRTIAKSKDCAKCNDTCSPKNYQRITVTSEQLRNVLCYGCRLIFNNSDMCDVPFCVLNAAMQRLAFDNMRNEITDFLL